MHSAWKESPPNSRLSLSPFQPKPFNDLGQPAKAAIQQQSNTIHICNFSSVQRRSISTSQPHFKDLVPNIKLETKSFQLVCQVGDTSARPSSSSKDNTSPSGPHRTSPETGTEQKHTGDISAFIRKSICTFRLAEQQLPGAGSTRGQQQPGVTGASPAPGNRSQPRKPNPAGFCISPSLSKGIGNRVIFITFRKVLDFRVLRVQHNDLELK